MLPRCSFSAAGSGKRKLEKRMRKYEEEQRIAKALATDTPLQMMSTLQRVQKLTHEVSATARPCASGPVARAPR